MAKRVHKAGKCDDRGNVSALCYLRPRPIDLRYATWTLRDEAVTCEGCALILKHKARREVTP